MPDEVLNNQATLYSNSLLSRHGQTQNFAAFVILKRKILHTKCRVVKLLFYYVREVMIESDRFDVLGRSINCRYYLASIR